MDVTSQLHETLVAVAVAAVLLIFHQLWRLRQTGKNRVPEIPGGLPFVGHLHLLRGKQTLARKLGSFSDKYGAVFSIRLGANTAVVVSEYEEVKECFTTNDRALAFRPESSNGKIFGYNYAVMGFAPYGNYLRDIKKILNNELLSVNRIKALRHVQISEIHFLASDLYSAIIIGGNNNIVINISDVLQGYVLNIITRMVAGKRYYGCANRDVDQLCGGRPIGEAMRELMLVSSTVVPSDAIPVLGWLGFQGALKDMKRVCREMDVILGSWIDEHKNNKTKKVLVDQPLDLIDVLLSEIKDEVAYGHNRDTIVKAAALSLIVAGSDTTWTTLTWILANLLNHKRVLKLAQEEINDKVGKERWVDDSDIHNLPYLTAVIKETLRMYPPAALSVPRIASQDIKIKGFDVPKGTWFFANFWKLHRDPNFWSNPDEFKPERFLTTNANVDIFGHQFEYLPFGSGRRGCLGTNFGMQMTQLILARLLQGFQWSTPDDKPVDMTEGVGIVPSMAIPFQVILSPSLSPQLYKP